MAMDTPPPTATCGQTSTGEPDHCGERGTAGARRSRRAACERHNATPTLVAALHSLAARATHLVERDRGLGAYTPSVILLLQKHWQRVGATEAYARRQLVQRHGRSSCAPGLSAERSELWARAGCAALGIGKAPKSGRALRFLREALVGKPEGPQPRASLRAPQEAGQPRFPLGRPCARAPEGRLAFHG